MSLLGGGERAADDRPTQPLPDSAQVRLSLVRTITRFQVARPNSAEDTIAWSHQPHVPLAWFGSSDHLAISELRFNLGRPVAPMRAWWRGICLAHGFDCSASAFARPLTRSQDGLA